MNFWKSGYWKTGFWKTGFWKGDEVVIDTDFFSSQRITVKPVQNTGVKISRDEAVAGVRNPVRIRGRQ